MATLTTDSARDFLLGDFTDQPIIAADIIYEGAAVGENGAGYARPLVAGDPFLGFATQQCDNSVGSAGDLNVKTRRAGRVELSIGSLAITDIGATVYASDDNTFTLTASTNTAIGTVSSFVSSGVGVVEFSAVAGVEPSLTDSSSGAASDTIAAIGATYTQDEVRDAVASLAAKINYLLAMQNS